jgi:hypothetical protein
MLTLDEIWRRLQDRRIIAVAEATGLHYNTVRLVASGQNKNPSYAVIKALSDYLTGEVVRG